MAQGKFSSKNRNSSVDIQTILAEREQAQKRQSSRYVPSAPSSKARPAQAPMTSVAKTKQNRNKGPRLSGLIFYTIFFLCIFLFYVATYFGLLELRDWLTQYEMAQPTTKSQEVFEKLFSNPDWGSLYDAAGVQDTVYESKGAFVSYMENTVGDSELTYVETSTGLSNDKKYIVRLGDKKIAAFTLVNQNQPDSQAEIADWQLGNIEFFIQREESYFIKKLDGHAVYVNDVLLDDSFTIRISTTNAEGYLPEGIAGIRICTQKISGLVTLPDVRIVDASGNEMEVVYDEPSNTFIEQTAATTIGDTERKLAINAIETYAMYMLKRAGEADIVKYFRPGSDAYNAITDTERGFVQDAASREFTNESVTDYCRYSDNLFSVRVAVTLSQYRTDGSVKENTIEQSMFFEKQPSGKWMCYAMTAVDVSKPVEKVRLTFMNEDVVLTSDFYDSDTHTLTCPIVSAPEGKVFSGWMVEGTDENGQVVMNLMFQPDENGVVTILPNTTLDPMILYPYFEDAK